MRKWMAVFVMLMMVLVPAFAVANGDDYDNGNGNGNGGNNQSQSQGQGQGQGQSQYQGQGQGQYQGQGQGQSLHNSNSNRNTNSNSNSNRNTNRNDNTAVGVGVGVGIGKGGSAKQQQSQGNVQSTAVDASQGDYPAQAPPAFAPNLVAAPETCMGSTAIGASTPFGGVAIGSTYKSDDCELRMFARSLSALGQNEAALALLAQNAKVAAALRAVGTKAAWLPKEQPVTVVAHQAPPSEAFVRGSTQSP